MFTWLKERRRRRVRERPFPAAWRAIIEHNVPYYRILPPEDREALLRHVLVFLDEKHFEGCAGFEITEEVRVTIAAHACVLLLHLDADYFPGLVSILVYPSSFYVEDHNAGEEDGVVSEWDELRSGESWEHGTVILAWDEVELSRRELGDGYNVVLHEFAHQLDQADGWADGAPLFADKDRCREWADVLERNYQKLVRDVRRNRRTLIDEYGATDPAEFFAVVTETFFELPVQLQLRHPDLYDAMRRYYGQDPAALIEATRAANPDQQNA